MAYFIDKTNCAYCGSCEHWCPFSAISPGEGGYEIDPDTCTECGICLDNCPTQTILPDDATPHRRRFSRVRILEQACIGCSLCARACPVGAITGQLRQPYVIDEAACIRCGVCLEKCRKDALQADWL